MKMSARARRAPAPTPDIVSTLASPWIPGAEPQFIRSFSNHVYLLPAGQERLYLRITAGGHRSRAQLDSELAWVEFLGQSGIAVARPVASRAGQWVHTSSQDGTTFHASVLGEAAGEEFARLTPSDSQGIFRTAGATMARLHAAGRRFIRPPVFRRFHWTEDRWARFADHVPPSEREAWALYRELRSWSGSLSRDSNLFGLVHGDFTIMNLRILDGQISLFDFDSCCEHWYAYEIATFLHYFGGQDPAARRRIHDEVLSGYAEVAEPHPGLVESIPRFGQMRLLYSFLVFAEEWGFENLTPEQESYFALRRRLFTQPPTWPHVWPQV